MPEPKDAERLRLKSSESYQETDNHTPGSMEGLGVEDDGKAINELVFHSEHLETTSQQTSEQEPALQDFAFAAGPEIDPLIGTNINGTIRIESVLGRGGLGVVYKARELMLDKPVAVKLLLPNKFVDAKAIMRFQREAQATSELSHPNVVCMRSFGVFEGKPYLVMDFVQGEPLSSLLKREGKLAEHRVVSFIKQIAEGLKHAHEKNIVHRDIKPGNVIVSKSKDGSEVLQLIDFGIAKVVSDEDTKNLTQTGEVFGTPNYMSPEQCNGQAVDYSTDVYSLGCMAYEMLSGAPPFTGENALKVIASHVSAKPTELNQSKAFPGLEKVIARCLAKDRSVRYPDASALLEDITRIEDRKQIAKTPLDKRAARRTAARVAIAAASVFLAAGLALTLLQLAQRTPSLDALNSTIAANPNDWQAIYQRAILYTRQENFRKAISDFNHVIALRPTYTKARCMRALCYLEIREMASASQDIEASIKLDPDYFCPYWLRATLHKASGRLDEGLADADKATMLIKQRGFNLDDKLPAANAYALRAALLVNTGRFDEAVKDATEALKIDEKFCLAFDNRAAANLSLGNADAAVDDLTKSLALNSKSADSLQERAAAYYVLQKNDLAMKDINEALLLRPESADCLILRARLYLRDNQRKNALKDLVSAEKLGSKAPSLKTLMEQARN